ncbi:MAG TPA: hypothetical protein VE973_03565 [Candidatus Limnocylindria bacterium]|nr:hypothetical protein [Candidatus Limnocylindria bacterium]
MKTKLILAMTMVLLVALSTVGNAFATDQYGIPAEQEYKNMFDALSLNPISFDLCSLYVRYNTAEYLSWATSQDIRSYLKKTDKDIELLRVKATREFALALSTLVFNADEYPTVDFFPAECSIHAPVGNTGTRGESIHLKNVYDGARMLREIISDKKNVDMFNDKADMEALDLRGVELFYAYQVTEPYQIDKVIENFGTRSAPQLRACWAGSSECKLGLSQDGAANLLYALVFKEHIQPKKLGLQNEEVGMLGNSELPDPTKTSSAKTK